MRLSDRIRLNVGGVHYETYKSTLLRFPSSVLAEMVTNAELDHNVGEQEIFLDRNGHIFQVILDFYSTDRLCIPRNTSFEAVQSEMDYFGLEIPDNAELFPSVPDLLLLPSPQELNQNETFPQYMIQGAIQICMDAVESNIFTFIIEVDGGGKTRNIPNAISLKPHQIKFWTEFGHFIALSPLSSDSIKKFFIRLGCQRHDQHEDYRPCLKLISNTVTTNWFDDPGPGTLNRTMLTCPALTYQILFTIPQRG